MVNLIIVRNGTRISYIRKEGKDFEENSLELNEFILEEKNIR